MAYFCLVQDRRGRQVSRKGTHVRLRMSHTSLETGTVELTPVGLTVRSEVGLAEHVRCRVAGYSGVVAQITRVVRMASTKVTQCRSRLSPLHPRSLHAGLALLHRRCGTADPREQFFVDFKRTRRPRVGVQRQIKRWAHLTVTIQTVEAPWRVVDRLRARYNVTATELQCL